ncbi:hypothetical protein ABZ896_06150 [Streptomyces sp. NPDC047072]|uniref:hypothetical protein n=1 Tax=Streptomyces sp. NPDC047072 TaxID=3154809 RepID=UPI0033D3CC06
MPDNTLDDRARGAWAAPLISTLLTLPACLVAYARADRLDASLGLAFPVLLGGLGVALFLLAGSWAMPWERHDSVRRRGLAVAAFCTVPLAYAVFAALIDRA